MAEDHDTLWPAPDRCAVISHETRSFGKSPVSSPVRCYAFVLLFLCHAFVLLPFVCALIKGQSLVERKGNRAQTAVPLNPTKRQKESG